MGVFDVIEDIIGCIVFVFSLGLVLYAMLSCEDIKEFVKLLILAYVLLLMLDVKQEIRKLSK